MASRVVSLYPGRRYYAGVDLPWFVPRAVVTSGAQDLGFRDIVWHDRSDPLPVNARTDPLYSDEWDEWATGLYVGPQKTETLEHAPAWIAMASTPEAQPVATAPAPDTPLDQVIAIARVALETANPEVIIRTAQVLQNGGYAGLAVQLRLKAAELGTKLLEAAAKPSNWPFFIALDVMTYGAIWLFVKRKKKRR